MIREPGGPVLHWWVGRCIENASARYSEPGLTLTAIARELGTSPVYLGALFRKQVGMSFKRHLLERRMQAAAVALEKGGAVKDAALSCGYKSASHFDRDFKRRFGTTPGAWRRSARGREISVQTAPDGLPGRP